jgi:AraC-like DNA-binding protein
MAEGVVHVTALIAAPQVLRDLGADPAEVAASVGLDLRLLDDPENIIPVATMGQFLRACVASTGCPYFGLLVGSRESFSSLGLVGYLVQHSPDVRTALRNLIRYLHHHERGAVPTLSVESGMATLGYAFLQRGVEATDQIHEGAMGIACNIMRDMCGRDWVPTAVLFSHRKPDDVRPHYRFFGAPVQFDAEQTALAFPASWLDRPLPGADAILRKLLQKRIDELEIQQSQDFPTQLRRLLRELVLAGDCSAERAARLLCVHRRTLHRRLQAHATTFADLADAVRYDISRQLLEDTHVPLSRIAAMLDYADASAFTRAFRRWSGTTPTAWRAQARRD